MLHLRSKGLLKSMLKQSEWEHIFAFTSLCFLCSFLLFHLCIFPSAFLMSIYLCISVYENKGKKWKEECNVPL